MNKIIHSEDGTASKIVVEVDGIKQLRTYHVDATTRPWKNVPDIKPNEHWVETIEGTFRIITIT